MSFPFPVFSAPATVTALAGQRALGARRAVFWRRRAIPPAVLWPLTLIAVALAIALALEAGQHVAALALLAVLVAGILLARYSGTGECAVLYEHGLVCARGGELRSVRWDEARYSWRGPADLAILPREDALTATGVAGAPGLTGDGGRLIVRGVSRVDRLLQLIDAELQPRALARGQAQLAAKGRADYPPLAITPAGIFAQGASGPVNAPWAAVDSYERTGGSLVISAFVADPAKGRIVKPWFRGLVADATAAERLMDATDPDPNALRPGPAAGAPQAGRRRVTWQAALFAVLVLGGALITLIRPATNGLGYADVCHGLKVPQAAAYTGSGAHPIDFEGGSAGFGGVTDNAGVLADEPQDWIPADAAAVQLVACVTGTQTDTPVSSCEYDGGQDVPVDEEQYTISVYAAQTGAQVGRPQTLDGEGDTCPDTITSVNGDAPSAFYTALTLSDVESVVDSAVPDSGS
jgi:hypothetical protein